MCGMCFLITVIIIISELSVLQVLPLCSNKEPEESCIKIKKRFTNISALEFWNENSWRSNQSQCWRNIQIWGFHFTDLFLVPFLTLHVASASKSCSCSIWYVGYSEYCLLKNSDEQKKNDMTINLNFLLSLIWLIISLLQIFLNCLLSVPLISLLVLSISIIILKISIVYCCVWYIKNYHV